MKYALINNSIVENVILADQSFADALTGYELKIQVDDTVGIGFIYDGNSFTAPAPLPPSIVVTPPTANFYASATSGTVPLLVNFFSMTTGAETFGWDFTNNGSIDADTANASFLYETAGTYSVRFTATNAGGTTTETKIDFIVVTDEPAPTPLPPHITLLALNLRMTRGERDAVRAAEGTDSDVSDVMYLMRQARYIDLERAETIAGLQMLEAKGLLGTGRADEILTAPIQDIERAPE